MRNAMRAAVAILLTALVVPSAIAQSPFDDVKLLPRLEFIESPDPIDGVHKLVPWEPGAGSSEESPPVAPHERRALSDDAIALVSSNNHFALDIYQRLSSAAMADENVLVSPFSISTALAMTYAGARGRTAEQMAEVLSFSLPDNRLHPAFGELMSDLNADREGYQLSIANRLFGQAEYPFEAPFLDTTDHDYGAPLEPVNFIDDPDGSRQRINEWVEDRTHDKIKDLLPKGSVTRDMRLVLTNAVYFNGSWKHKFDADATHEDMFHTIGGGESQVQMMWQQHLFAYAEQPCFQMLEMPYAGDDLSMVVMLPNERDGLAALEQSLTTESLDESLAALRSETVNVDFPKFTFDSSFRLGDALKGLGITDAFDPDFADFSGIVDPAIEPLYIGLAMHKTFIDVNEEGTEAAAATAIGMVTTTDALVPPEPKEFRADHPFLFALRDRHSGSLLFLGRVANPGELVAAAQLHVPEPSAATLLLIGLIGLLAPGCPASRRMR